jgi:diguanylate cyclase (GGDEF)-like protein
MFYADSVTTPEVAGLTHPGPANPILYLTDRGNFMSYLSEKLGSTHHLAVMVIDVDHMGEVNMNIGRAQGDEVLYELARRLRIICGPHHRPARIGGDRFALLMTVHNRDETDQAALTVLRVLSAPITVAGRNVKPSVSIGVARGYPGGRAGNLLDTADAALTEAKAAGGHVWRVATTGAMMCA